MKEWSERHLRVLRSLYPAENWPELMAALPGRGRRAIVQKAKELGLVRILRSQNDKSARRGIIPISVILAGASTRASSARRVDGAPRARGPKRVAISLATVSALGDK